MSAGIRLPRVNRFLVEEGHIKLFARAIGDANPIYSDWDYARKSSLGGIVAPPTFTEASNHFDEDWPFRPRWGQPWFGSAATPTGVKRGESDHGTEMHAESHFVYHRVLRPGMVLSVRARQGRQWEKCGPRSGTLTFNEIVAEFCDQDGMPVVECATVALRTERTVAAEAAPEPDSRSCEPASVPPSAYPRQPLHGAHIRTGDKIQDVLVRNLSRAQIVQYAGVSGDFAPQHIDEVYNTQAAGYPSVFAHGMFTMGMTGRVVTDFVGDGRLKKFGLQFRRQVWPGDSLFAVAAITGIDAGPSVSLAIEVTNQHRQLVAKGYAEAAIDDD